MNKRKPTIYIKPKCPWCITSLKFFEEKEVSLNIVDITTDVAGRQRMLEISGQYYVPTFEYGTFIVPDFSVEEFQKAVEAVPEIKEELGL